MEKRIMDNKTLENIDNIIQQETKDTAYIEESLQEYMECQNDYLDGTMSI